jgi:hypothetical protein
MLTLNRIHTAWAGYVGGRPKDLTPDVHLDIYRAELERAKILKPVRVNAQSGGYVLLVTAI